MERIIINHFNQLELSEQMLKSLGKMKFETPTKVQALAIGPMLTGQDLIVQAPTGTGKTCAFGIPAVELAAARDQQIQSVILCPTRELAIQSTAVIRQLTAFKPGIRIQAVYGGEPLRYQIPALKRNPQIVIATPGRLLDHIARKTIRLDSVKQIILDEADRMLDMGFRDDIDEILQSLPQERQTVLFSATLSPEIKRIAALYQNEAQKIEVGPTAQTGSRIEQYYSEVGSKIKAQTLEHILREKQFGLSLVFVATKSMADRLSSDLNGRGFQADALHGGLSQKQRDMVMKKYRNGKIQVLIATDIAARGIDVNNIDTVINYDIPGDAESYIHRIGRTGRAAQTGTAYTFVSAQEHRKFKNIMRAVKAEIHPLKLAPYGGRKPQYKPARQAAGL